MKTFPGHVSVAFVAAPGGAASATTSSIRVDSQAVAADGTSKATITVALENTAGGAVPGRSVTLEASAKAVHLASGSATTDTNGLATFTATSASAVTTTFTADESADSPTLGRRRRWRSTTTFPMRRRRRSRPRPPRCPPTGRARRP